MGAPLPIQVSEIIGYAKIHGFSHDLKFFYRCMVEMDLEYFKYQSEKAESNPPQNKTGGGPRPLKRKRGRG